MGSGMTYGGEDIGALVFDIGNDSLRVGYAQDATPKAIIPSVVGTLDEASPAPVSIKSEITDTGESVIENILPSPKRKYYIDTNYLHCARQGMEVSSFMKDGMIEDWELFEKVLDYTYAKCIQSEPTLHPVLLSEPPWNERAKREKLIEIMFEKYNVPAFFLVKNAVLSAFANGRVTGIVVDSGASHTSAVPILDGFVISKAVVKSPIGGDYITGQCKNYLQQENDIDIVPKYVVRGKETTKDRECARRTRKKNLPEVTQSWHNYMTKKVIQDFQASILQICETPFDKKVVQAMPSMPYEFPYGYHRSCGMDRFLIPEALFDPSVIPARSGFVGNNLLGVGQIVTSSVGLCDIDVRPSLYGNVVITGGNSFLKGFTERLNRDLAVRIPSSMRLKLISPNSSTERRFAAWIGGSILASIGTCQQFWISSQEYKEEGKGQVDRKCP